MGSGLWSRPSYLTTIGVQVSQGSGAVSLLCSAHSANSREGVGYQLFTHNGTSSGSRMLTGYCDKEEREHKSIIE